MICKVINTIEKHKMLNGVRSVAVGLSGGADSMCLINVLLELKSRYNIVIKAVHVNHNVRGNEAERDECFVREFCNKMGIELLSFKFDIPSLSKKYNISEEECGRNIRYDCFAKADCDVVATAHTLSDSVETVVFNLLRGTGSKGLKGIPAKRYPNIIRPLIDCTREEIETYCRNNDISFITDSSNLTDIYKRNYIRHNIVPAFSEINKSALRSIAKTSEIIEEESDFIDECAKRIIESSKNENGYNLSDYLTVHSAVRKRAIRLLLQKYMKKSVEYRHVTLCDEAILNKKGKVELSEDLYILVDSDIIDFRRSEMIVEPWEGQLVVNKFVTPYGSYTFEKTVNGVGVDFDKIKGDLVVSSRKDGDKIYLKNRGLTKSLKKIFNELKIPSADRNKLAVLRDCENIIWVEGVGIDGNYLSDKSSKNVFTITKDV